MTLWQLLDKHWDDLGTFAILLAFFGFFAFTCWLACRRTSND